jgi:hypothetical protein
VTQKTKKLKSANLSSLQDVISRAIKKIGAKKENDICQYLPVKDGYIHHFTMRKMKNEQPAWLQTMIEKHIINVTKPSKVAPKKRAPRGSRKRPEQVSLTRTELENLISLVQSSGDNSLLNKLTPKKSLAACRKELIRSIKNNEIRSDLWTMYSETVRTINAVSSGELSKEPTFVFATSGQK